MAKKTVRKQIREAADQLEQIMGEYLAHIGEDLVEQIMRNYRGLSPSQQINAIKGIAPKGVQTYKTDLLDVLATLAYDSIEDARREVPKAKNVRLYDGDPGTTMLADFNKLTPSLQKKLKTRADLLVGKQIGDLQKVIEFAFTTAEEETDSEETIENDIRDSAVGFLGGTAIESGANLTAASVINEARNAFFFDDDVLEEIDAFEFVNGDPVTEICQDLSGTVFGKDDPNADRYFPPLHWNCKSSIQPILKGKLGNKEIEKLKPSKSKLDDQVLFAERLYGRHTCASCKDGAV